MVHEASSIKRAVVAVLIAFCSTAIFGAAAIWILQGVLHLDISSIWVGLGIFVTLLLFAWLVLDQLGKHFIFKSEAADLQIVGGVRFGSYPAAIISGKGATWPFAKLLAARDKLWIVTPWGTLTWPKSNMPRLVRVNSFLSHGLRVEDVGGKNVTFLLGRRGVEKLVRGLEHLGYEIGG